MPNLLQSKHSLVYSVCIEAPLFKISAALVSASLVGLFNTDKKSSNQRALYYFFICSRLGPMESRLLKDFVLEPKNPSVEALRRWRSAVTLVKNRRRRFRMVADLDKRSEVEQIKQGIKVFFLQFSLLISLFLPFHFYKSSYC